MLKTITDYDEIGEIQDKFENVIKKHLNEKVFCKIGHQSGSFDVTANYSSKFDLWFTPFKEENRFWNAFGIGKPNSSKSSSIVCEINFPYENIDRRIAGVFAKDIFDKIFILHRGKIGGGRKGIGKKLFFDNYRGEFISAIDGNTENVFALIGELNSENFILQLKNFVYEISRIKSFDNSEIVVDEITEINTQDFSEEFYGQKSYTKSELIQFECNHGFVVNSLAKIFENENLSIGNDRNRDLYIKRNSKINTLFEVKTDISNFSLYSAIGQLIINSIDCQTAKKIMVLPNKISEKIENALKNYEIKILYYNLENQKISFENIDNMIDEIKTHNI